MKKYLMSAMVATLLFSSCQTTKNVNQFMDKYEYAENATNFQVPLSMADWFSGSQSEFRALRKKVKSIQVLTLNELDETQSAALKQELGNALQQDDFQNWFSQNKEGKLISINSQGTKRSLKNLVVSFQKGEKLMIIKARTKLNQNEITRLVEQLVSND